MLEELILFIMTFLLVFIVYEIFIVRKSKKDKRRKKPIEVNYLINKYNLDIDKLNYKKLLNNKGIILILTNKINDDYKYNYSVNNKYLYIIKKN